MLIKSTRVRRNGSLIAASSPAPKKISFFNRSMNSENVTNLGVSLFDVQWLKLNGLRRQQCIKTKIAVLLIDERQREN